jgi:hypothetical protein
MVKRTRGVKSKVPDKRGDKPISIRKEISDLILKQDKPVEVLALYWFYCYTANWQKTDQAHAKDTYCMNQLHLGYKRFISAKNILLELNLIEKVQNRGKHGEITGWYIRVNQFFIKKDQNPHLDVIGPDVSKPRSSNQKLNALRSIRIYSLGKLGFPKDWQEDQKLILTMEKYIQWRKEKGFSIDLPLIRNLSQRLINLGSIEKAISSINAGIKNQWKGINPPYIPRQPKCPIKTWTFGVDFHDSKQGCMDCEDDHYKTYVKCKKVFYSIKQNQ